jgi:D-alanyl-D-alanine carboxypeptidase
MPNSQTYRRRIAKIHRQLGIDPSYARERNLTLQKEPGKLVDAGPDIFGRPQQLTEEAMAGWEKMKSAAANDGVVLALVSAFRGVDYQRGIIERKLATGTDIAAVLEVNAAPGYSEHHTGRAIDITTPGDEPLEASFETTAAFRWLRERASAFGFSLSYPHGNPYGIAYEPWHWCYGGSSSVVQWYGRVVVR